VGRWQADRGGREPVGRRFDKAAVELARSQLLKIVPAQARTHDLSDADADELLRFFLVDFDRYVAPAVEEGVPPAKLERKDMASATDYHISSVNDKLNKLAPAFAKAALASVLHLSLRAGGDAVTARVEPLGGPKKRFFGPMLPLDGIEMYGLLVGPHAGLDASGLARRIIDEVLDPLVEAGEVVKELTAAAAVANGVGGRPVEPDWTPKFRVLIPPLAVGHDEGKGKRAFLCPEPEAIETWASEHDVAGVDSDVKIVLELTAIPEIGEGWHSYFSLKELLGRDGRDAPLFDRMSLETHYLPVVEENRLVAVHRSVSDRATDDGEAGLGSSFVTIGFGSSNPELLQALELTESMSPRRAVRATECAACFGLTMEPLETRLIGPAGMSFVCSSRLLAYALLVSASRMLLTEDPARH
jgi:hypothetical protein